MSGRREIVQIHADPVIDPLPEDPDNPDNSDDDV
jgi:hypothetical protein